MRQPFTAPCEMPSINCFWKIMKMMIGGSIESTMTADSMPKAQTSPLNSVNPTVRGIASGLVANVWPRCIRPKCCRKRE